MKVTIIGGGIAGLTMALAFEKVDINYHLFEKASVLNEIGAGIWVSSNAMQVYAWLGIADQIQAKGLSLEQIEITDQRFKVLQQTNQNVFVKKLTYAGTAIHRSVLQRILFDQVPREKIELNHEASEFVQKDNGKTILQFTNGTSITSDAIVGADGINSPIRNQISPNSTMRDSGQVCWRGISNIEIPVEMRNKSAECWGDQIRFGFSPIGKNQVYWFAVAKNKRVKENLSKPEIIALFSNFHPFVHRLIENTEEEAIIFRPLFDLKPMRKWHKGRIILVGDAAHATTPNLGQGAAQGIEDAFYLSQYLKRASSIEEAFITFEKNRRPKVNSVVSTSWSMGKLAHIKYGQKLRNTALRITPGIVMEKRMLQLYTLKPL
ncbi:MAG: FAD-dependent monooxygenase [Prolixibacteraceae bacterium]